MIFDACPWILGVSIGWTFGKPHKPLHLKDGVAIPRID